jgi:hypothetical protein
MLVRFGTRVRVSHNTEVTVQRDQDTSDEDSENHLNPFAKSYYPKFSAAPTMRDMVATFVFLLTVVAARKHAKDFNVKQSGISQSGLRGVLFAAIAAKVRDDENISGGTVVDEDCKAFREDPANQGKLRRQQTELWWSTCRTVASTATVVALAFVALV